MILEEKMNEERFKARTKHLGLRVIKLANVLPNTRAADVLGRQVLRSATSVGANYRAACRAKSIADIINKLKIVEEETDETLYWMELIVESNLVALNRMESLMTETNEILAMTVASIKTLRSRMTSEPTRSNNRKS
jgi:four helix bundle protein